MTSHEIFVYGTLKGRENAEPAKIIGAIPDPINALNLMPLPGGETRGEIITVNTQELKKLDQYEDEGQTYHRIQIQDTHIYIRSLGRSPEQTQNKFQHATIQKVNTTNA